MRSAASTPEKTGLITLRGSTETVVEFFGYAINSILYQRGVYPAEHFTSVSKYGLSILVTKDKGLQEYLGEVLRQLKGWMMCSQVRKLVVVVASQVTEETLERWTFDVQVNDAHAALAVPQTQADKVREQKEIQAHWWGRDVGQGQEVLKSHLKRKALGISRWRNKLTPPRPDRPMPNRPVGLVEAALQYSKKTG
eukprot:g17443.t1